MGSGEGRVCTSDPWWELPVLVRLAGLDVASGSQARSERATSGPRQARLLREVGL